MFGACKSFQHSLKIYRDAVWTPNLNRSHVYLSMAIFLAGRYHPYKWIAIVSWLNCLIQWSLGLLFPALGKELHWPAFGFTCFGIYTLCLPFIMLHPMVSVQPRHRWNPNRHYHSEPKCTCWECQWRGTPHFQVFVYHLFQTLPNFWMSTVTLEKAAQMF